jgi:hypothetical protein
MANQPHKFKDRDVQRVVRAARRVGVDVARITVNPNTGEITVATARSGEDGNDLDNWLRKKDAHPA